MNFLEIILIIKKLKQNIIKMKKFLINNKKVKKNLIDPISNKYYSIVLIINFLIEEFLFNSFSKIKIKFF